METETKQTKVYTKEEAYELVQETGAKGAK